MNFRSVKLVFLLLHAITTSSANWCVGNPDCQWVSQATRLTHTCKKMTPEKIVRECDIHSCFSRQNTACSAASDCGSTWTSCWYSSMTSPMRMPRIDKIYVVPQAHPPRIRRNQTSKSGKMLIPWSPKMP